MFDILFTGVTGQVGRSVFRATAHMGSIAVILRRGSVDQAELELKNILGEKKYAFSNVTILLGDLTTAILPNAKIIIHAAGVTTFEGPLESYWNSNVTGTLRIIHHAIECGAHLHLLSTISVSSCRNGLLAEESTPIPHHNQTNYSLTKSLVEMCAINIVEQSKLTIYRISDVVPDQENLEQDIRRNHWLTILLGNGKPNEKSVLDKLSFYIITDTFVASIIKDCVQLSLNGVFHLFGHLYEWSLLKKARGDSGRKSLNIVRYMEEKISFYSPPLADLVTDSLTQKYLANKKIEYPRLGMRYWEKYAQLSKEITNKRLKKP